MCVCVCVFADAVHLVQSVANNGQYGNARVQPIMIKKLAGEWYGLSLSLSLLQVHVSLSPFLFTELTDLAYDQKPQLVCRHVLPVMWHLLSARVPATGEAKGAAMALCGALWQCMGQSFLDSASHLSPEHKKSLKDMVDRLNIT